MNFPPNKHALNVQLTIGGRIKMLLIFILLSAGKPYETKKLAQQDHYKKAQIFPIWEHFGIIHHSYNIIHRIHSNKYLIHICELVKCL